MTNKLQLPVIGKRYRATEANEFIHNKDYIMRCDEILSDRVILDKDKRGAHIGYPIDDFFKYFEEITGIKVNQQKKSVTLELTDEQLEKIKDIING